MHKGQVAFGGQNNVHLHSPQRCEIQRRDQRGIGQEIGRENLHGGLRLGQRGEQRPPQFFKIRIRPVGDDAGHQTAVLRQFGKPEETVQHFISRERPVVGERLL